MGLWDERFSRCYSIVWLRELVLGLLEVLTTSKHGCTIPTLVDMGNPGQMELEEALEKALDGDAVIFAGTGCSDGATNLRDQPLPNGPALAHYLAEKAGLASAVPLEDAAEAFAEKHGDDALIREIQYQFTAKQIAAHHREIAEVPWKRLYTTNYDDVLEEAYKANSKQLTAVTIGDVPTRIPKDQTICVHLNGFVHRLDRQKIHTELKLTEASYITASLAESEWAMLFRQDIRLARAVFFVGYSLYDLDIKRILFDSPLLKAKCFFVLGSSPDASTTRRAERFGSVLTISTEEFGSLVRQKSQTYTPVERRYLSTVSIREHITPLAGSRVTDRAFVDLLLFGIANGDMMFESLKTGKPYLLERKARDRVFQLIDKGERVIAVCSDLGNGKSLFLDGLRLRAAEHGFRVFEATEQNEEAAGELQRIAQLDEKVLVTIEGYQDWMNEIRLFRVNASTNAVLVLTARNAVHDVVVDDLMRVAGLESIPELQLDTLDDVEIAWFIDALDEYGLWGEWAAKSRPRKEQFLKQYCRGQIHAILLKILASPDIAQRLRALSDSFKRSRPEYEVFLSACILTLVSKTPDLDTLIDIWGTDILSSQTFRRNPAVRQFLDFNQNEVLVKSPVAAQYVLNNIADPALTVSVLTKIASRANAGAGASQRYQSMLSNLMRFSNLQTILPEDGRAGAVIGYYESIKNLSRCKRSPLFWLQYAIACLQINELFRAKRYFESAYSFAERTFDPFQIDNHYARFLLVEAIQNLTSTDAMTNFRKARTIINQQIRDERLHYPYRVASHYQLFLDRFEPSLSSNQIEEIGNAAKHVHMRIEGLPYSRKRHRYVRECQKAMDYVMNRAKLLSKAPADLDEKTENR